MRSELIVNCIFVFALFDISGILNQANGMFDLPDTRDVVSLTAVAHPVVDFLDTAIQPTSGRCKLADIIWGTEARIAVAGLATIQSVEREQLLAVLAFESNSLCSLFLLGVALRL